MMGNEALAAALLEERPATSNPLMLAKVLRQQQAYPRENIQQAMNYPQDWSQFGQNISQAYPTSSPEAVRQAAYQAAVNAGPLMTVWQGSPHKFVPTKNNPLGEFDASKIGSGEGAQAYGYGHYLAENPAVAREYAGANAGRAAAFEGSIDKLPKPIQVETYKAMQMKDGPIKSATIQDIVSRYPETASVFGSKTGSLYKVDLPDEHIAKMLDWDKPLSQQPESVRKFFDPLIAPRQKTMAQSGDPRWGELSAPAKYDPTGQELLGMLRGQGMDANSILGNGLGPEVSARLRAAGIPGIRYLDGGSRAGGQGTSNFVVFPGNEGILKILGRE